MVINIINNNLLDDCYYKLSKTFGLMILNINQIRCYTYFELDGKMGDFGIWVQVTQDQGNDFGNPRIGKRVLVVFSMFVQYKCYIGLMMWGVAPHRIDEDMQEMYKR